MLREGAAGRLKRVPGGSLIKRVVTVNPGNLSRRHRASARAGISRSFVPVCSRPLRGYQIQQDGSV